MTPIITITDGRNITADGGGRRTSLSFRGVWFDSL